MPTQIDAGEAEEEPDIAAAIRGLSDADLTRLRALAGLRARTLPGVDWSDLLNEAIVRALDGTRRWSPTVPILAFLAGIMRSIDHDHRRRLAQERTWRAQGGDDVTTRDPDEAIAAAQALNIIYVWFASDLPVLRIIEGLACGRSAVEIRVLHQMSETEYDTARKRLRRALLKFESGGGRR
jgi:DNA-directed RNA polymerase specialized sigma24 family protein